MIMAPPNAMNARAPINAATLGEKAASTEPAQKITSPASSIRRWPTLSASVPMGISRLAINNG